MTTARRAVTRGPPSIDRRSCTTRTGRRVPARAARRGPAEVAAGEGDVRGRPVDVPALGRMRVEREPPAGETLERGDHVREGRLLASTDVVDLGRGRGVGAAHGGVDGVGHEREVPRLRTVAEERERRVRDEGVADPAHGHVGTLARAVDGEVAQARDGEAPGAVDAREVLAGALRDAVRRARQRGRRVLTAGVGLRVAVDRRRRGPARPARSTPNRPPRTRVGWRPGCSRTARSSRRSCPARRPGRPGGTRRGTLERRLPAVGDQVLLDEVEGRFRGQAARFDSLSSRA